MAAAIASVIGDWGRNGDVNIYARRWSCFWHCEIFGEAMGDLLVHHFLLFWEKYKVAFEVALWE
jgi:hypothetical protein